MKVALRKSKSPGGKVNFEGNISGRGIPRGGTQDTRTSTTTPNMDVALAMTKRGSGNPATLPGPDSGKVRALDGAAPRRSGIGGRGPTLPPIA